MSDGLELRHLRIEDQDRNLIDVNFTVRSGEILSVMGPSGVGKSTLLSAITGTISPDFRVFGEIFLDGKPLCNTPPHTRRVGILFQDDILFPHMSVGQNLAFGLVAGGTRAERRQLVRDALSEVGLDGYEDRDPATLSGGQASRVQLIRMLLSQPKALLLDEAFSRLDATLRQQVREMVFDRARARMLPVLMVTHDAEDARAAGGPIIDLSPG